MHIPGYIIERELGHGGMATVYLAVQESLGRRVALKIMVPALTADRSFGERFLREARTVAQLSHQNILAVHDIGSSDHSYYMAMEYVPGGDLKQRIRQGALPPDQALVILKQIAKAIGYAHLKGFVHRDVKPENILFREDGTAVLTDFGIAKAVGSGTKMTGTGMTIGTAHYMSPEQAQGRGDLDGRSDLYSLGIVFYEMIVGCVPYDADNTVGIAMQHVNGTLPELPTFLSAYQPLLDRLLAKDTGERFTDAGELIAAINKLQAGRTLERPAPKTEVMKGFSFEKLARMDDEMSDRQTGRGSGFKWGIGGALLALLLVGGLWLVQKSSRAVVPSSGPLPMVTETFRPETESASQRPLTLPRRQNIDRLLTNAQEDLQALRLTNPAGNNALEKFEQVLRLEPGNAAAQKGIANIVEQYLRLTDEAIGNSAFEKAKRYLDKVDKIRPVAPGLDHARQRLANAVRKSRFEAFLVAGENALERGAVEAAQMKFQAALELFPSNAEAKRGLEKAQAEIQWQIAKKKLLQPDKLPGDNNQKFIAFAGAKVPGALSPYSKIYQLNRQIFDDLYSSTNLVAEKLKMRGLRPKVLGWHERSTGKEMPLYPDSKNLVAIEEFHSTVNETGEYVLGKLADTYSAQLICFFEFMGEIESIMSDLEKGECIEVSIYVYCNLNKRLSAKYLSINPNDDSKTLKNKVQKNAVLVAESVMNTR